MTKETGRGRGTNKELIDTWWDVNLLATSACPFLNIELIDTWWDVNPDKNAFSQYEPTRINRYMVGCK
mgnify:CR=1 FL=1